MLDQLSEGVLLIEPEAQNALSSTTEQKYGSDLNPSSYMDNANTSAQITYNNNSLLSILNQREKQKDIFGIDVDELLTEMKFKVLFSTNQVRQNLKDYILKIYRSIIDENNALDKAKMKKENLTTSVSGLFNSFNNNEDGGGD